MQGSRHPLRQLAAGRSTPGEITSFDLIFRALFECIGGRWSLTLLIVLSVSVKLRGSPLLGLSTGGFNDHNRGSHQEQGRS